MPTTTTTQSAHCPFHSLAQFSHPPLLHLIRVGLDASRFFLAVSPFSCAQRRMTSQVETRAPPCAYKGSARHAQVKFHVQSVTPDEYDAAVARAPHRCPLLLLGDRRPGRLLLVDAPADAARGIAALTNDPLSAAALRDVARRVTALAAAAASG